MYKHDESAKMKLAKDEFVNDEIGKNEVKLALRME